MSGAMNSASGYVGAVRDASPPKAQTAFERALLVAEAVGSLSIRVEALADRLLGSVPQDSASKQSASGNGLLGALHDMTETTAARVAYANDALDRIERALP